MNSKKNFRVASHKVLLVYSGKVKALSPENIEKNRQSFKCFAFNKLHGSPNPRFFTPKVNHIVKPPSNNPDLVKKKEDGSEVVKVNHQGFKSFHGKLFTNKRLELVGKPVSKSNKLVRERASGTEQNFPSQSIIYRKMKNKNKETEAPRVQKKLFADKTVEKLPSLVKVKSKNSLHELKLNSLESDSSEGPDITEVRRKYRRDTFEKIFKISSSVSLAGWD